MIYPSGEQTDDYLSQPKLMILRLQVATMGPS